jgi:hypothetical protein
MVRRSAWTGVLAAGALVFFAEPAFAYIDPGSGSYLIQLLIGTVVGAGAFLVFPFRKALGRLKRRRSEAAPRFEGASNSER